MFHWERSEKARRQCQSVSAREGIEGRRREKKSQEGWVGGERVEGRGVRRWLAGLVACLAGASGRENEREGRERGEST